jgi:hypothetical protein
MCTVEVPVPACCCYQDAHMMLTLALSSILRSFFFSAKDCKFIAVLLG